MRLTFKLVDCKKQNALHNVGGLLQSGDVPTEQKADPPANNKSFSHLMAFDLGLPSPFQRAFELKHQLFPVVQQLPTLLASPHQYMNQFLIINLFLHIHGLLVPILYRTLTHFPKINSLQSVYQQDY